MTFSYTTYQIQLVGSDRCDKKSMDTILLICLVIFIGWLQFSINSKLQVAYFYQKIYEYLSIHTLSHQIRRTIKYPLKRPINLFVPIDQGIYKYLPDTYGHICQIPMGSLRQLHLKAMPYIQLSVFSNLGHIRWDYGQTLFWDLAVYVSVIRVFKKEVIDFLHPVTDTRKSLLR